MPVDLLEKIPGMRSGKSRAITTGIAVVGVVVLVAAGVALKRPILESWHIHLLDSDDEQKRMEAAQTLGEMKSVRAVPRLLELLQTEHGEFISLKKLHYTVQVLVEIGDAAAPILADSLVVHAARAEPDREFFRQLRAIFSKIGARVVSSLAEVLRRDNCEQAKRYALWMLEEIHDDERVVPALVETLRDKIQSVRRVAALRLSRRDASRAKAAVPVFVEMLTDKNVRDLLEMTVVERLGNIGPDARVAVPILMKRLQSGDERLQKAARQALKRMSDE